VCAAFLAADEGDQAVAMEHLLRATQREYQKMGKVITAEFGEAVDQRPLVVQATRSKVQSVEVKS
jgi:hypothetical protein